MKVGIGRFRKKLYIGYFYVGYGLTYTVGLPHIRAVAGRQRNSFYCLQILEHHDLFRGMSAVRKICRIRNYIAHRPQLMIFRVDLNDIIVIGCITHSFAEGGSYQIIRLIIERILS